MPNGVHFSFNEYQQACKAFDRSPGTPEYYALGLTGESGEVAELVKKSIRTGIWHKPIENKRRDDLKLELGDVLWYVGQMGARFGFTLQDIADSNIDKLTKRMAEHERA